MSFGRRGTVSRGFIPMEEILREEINLRDVISVDIEAARMNGEAAGKAVHGGEERTLVMGKLHIPPGC